jgi:hypothetical protein
LKVGNVWYRLAESALDALSNMVTHPDTHKYPSTCIQFLGKLLPLKQIIEAHQQHRDGGEEGDQVSHNAAMFDRILLRNYMLKLNRRVFFTKVKVLPFC